VFSMLRTIIAPHLPGAPLLGHFLDGTCGQDAPGVVQFL
jgi:hypothetical protein